MKAAVLGLGRIGHSIAALLAKRGLAVAGYTRDARKADAVNAHGITVSGAFEGNFRVGATTDIAEAVRGASVVVVTTVSSGHAPVARALRGLLEEGQTILIMTGNWGAYEFFKILGDEARDKGVVIGETGGNIAAVPEVVPPATVFVKPPKNNMNFATAPSGDAGRALDVLKPLLPQLYAVKNILDTSLCNPNPSVHVPVAVLNLARIASGERTLLFGDAMPDMVLDYITAADAERCAVAHALGGNAVPILDWMNGVWGTDFKDLRTLGQNVSTLSNVYLPVSLDHRYLSEDVPFGFMPISRLGKVCGVPTPHIDALVEMYRLALGKRAVLDGPVFDEGFGGVL